jgi:hypothetical protein
VSLALLGGGFDYSAAAQDEFDDWYDTEHIPERLRIDGFLNGVRWIGAANPKISLAIYDLESLDVLRKPEYRAVSPENFSPWATRMLVRKCKRLCRFNCIQLNPGDAVAPDAAQGLLVAATDVAAEADAEFNDWYDREHLPRLAAVPGVLAARRFTSPGAGQSMSRPIIWLRRKCANRTRGNRHRPRRGKTKCSRRRATGCASCSDVTFGPVRCRHENRVDVTTDYG